MDIDEIFDKIASNYTYRYTQFLEEVTPRMASRFLEIISVRENNDYCYNAMMHGQDMKKFIITPKVEETPTSEKVSQEDKDKAAQHVQMILERGRNVKR